MATVADHRAVPLEAVRELARDESERTSLRQVAAASGVGRTTLHKFLSGETSPHPRIRRLLALWYLRERSAVMDAAVIAAYAGAVELLLGALTAESRRKAWGELIDALESLYESSGVALPAGLAALRERGPEAPTA